MTEIDFKNTIKATKIKTDEGWLVRHVYMDLASRRCTAFYLCGKESQADVLVAALINSQLLQ